MMSKVDIQIQLKFRYIGLKWLINILCFWLILGGFPTEKTLFLLLIEIVEIYYFLCINYEFL